MRCHMVGYIACGLSSSNLGEWWLCVDYDALEKVRLPTVVFLLRSSTPKLCVPYGRRILEFLFE